MGIFSRLSKYSDFGLLLMRVGVGAMMVVHGYPKLMGGPEKWESLGKAIGRFGISSYPEAWGLLAALTEALGGVLLILGLAFRPVCFLLLIEMVVAASMHMSKGDPLIVASHAIELAAVFLGLFFIGPGKFSIDRN